MAVQGVRVPSADGGKGSDIFVGVKLPSTELPTSHSGQGGLISTHRPAYVRRGSQIFIRRANYGGDGSQVSVNKWAKPLCEDNESYLREGRRGGT